ncbi:S1 family peptidase [Candidatus Frankia alpina]|uniref:S1 family peptidase n=1 Tax=Candidatus Frankia alpina TaxID=2699483 RepID=A0A4S5CPR7_9ACTN|nr:S1 family peptidase [Candidatus Frankia alpina]THJ48087.1 S1 family peptidase [Candidatus Frankia alpina]
MNIFLIGPLFRQRIPERMRAVLTVAILAISGTVLSVTPAIAVPQSRSAEPFMAGTTMFSATKRCTAGLVLKDNSFFGGITEYRRSVRFILTAGHCGSVGDQWTTTSGQVVGKAVWKSAAHHDFLLIRVEPRRDLGVAPGCIPGSQRLPCVVVSSHYYPRAVGRVFTNGPVASESAPVNGTSMSGIEHCLGLGFSGAVCRHRSTERPRDEPADPPDAQDLSFTRGPVRFLQQGDSGSPLFSNNGNVFGIFNGRMSDLQGARYTKVLLFFYEQTGYALAPPE